MTTRTFAAAVALLAALAGAATPGATWADTPVPAPTPTPTTSASPPAVPAGPNPRAAAALLGMVNAYRQARGLSTLTVDPRLASIAATHTGRMLARGTLFHNEPLFTHASHVELGMSVLGENVAVDYSVAGAHDALLHSPLHLKNIVLPGFRVAGFAVDVDSTGRFWVTEDFGQPRTVRAAVTRPAPRRVAVAVAVARHSSAQRVAVRPAVARTPTPTPARAQARPAPTPSRERPAAPDAVPVAVSGPAPLSGRSVGVPVAVLLLLVTGSGTLRSHRRKRLARR